MELNDRRRRGFGDLASSTERMQLLGITNHMRAAQQ
jgi:hypothetical protein